LFVFNDTGVIGDNLMRKIAKSNIAVSSGGTSDYTTIFTSAEIGKAFNVRIYNGLLEVSFNELGVATKEVLIYNPKIEQTGSSIVFDDYLEFNDECIDTPISLSSNHRVFVDFQYNSFISQIQLIGNTAGNTSNFYGGGLWNGTYQDRFYVRTTTGEQSTILSDYTIRHTFDVNNDGKIYIDGDYWLDGTQNTNASVNYTIGYRGADHKFIGKIYRFFIYDMVNDEYLIDLRPAHIGNTYGMYDIINQKLYTKQSR
jgi:hypothetical protein